MSSNWHDLHRRHEVLERIDNDVSAAEDHNARDVFGDFADLLRAAHQQWITTLGGAIETALEVGDGDLLADVRHAWQVSSERHPGLRALLDQHADHPAVRPLVRREHDLVARATGIPRAADLVRSAARQEVRVPQHSRSLLARLFSWSFART